MDFSDIKDGFLDAVKAFDDTDIVIPKNIDQISLSAFSNCPNLKTVTVEGDDIVICLPEYPKSALEIIFCGSSVDIYINRYARYSKNKDYMAFLFPNLSFIKVAQDPYSKLDGYIKNAVLGYALMVVRNMEIEPSVKKEYEKTISLNINKYKNFFIQAVRYHKDIIDYLFLTKSLKIEEISFMMKLYSDDEEIVQKLSDYRNAAFSASEIEKELSANIYDLKRVRKEWKISDNGDGTAAVKGFKYCNDSNVMQNYNYQLKIPPIAGNLVVTQIGDKAFENCSEVQKIVIPESIKKIGNDAFHGCIKLQEITYLGTDAQWNAIEKCPGWNKHAGGQANGYIIHCRKDESQTVATPFAYEEKEDGTLRIIGYKKSNTEDTDIVVPDVIGGHTVTEIGSSAFRNDYITSISMPNSVTKIGDNAFEECEKLTSITITGITEIGKNAFKECRNLTSITIPSSVKKIGSYAFFGCGPLFGSERLAVHINNPTAWCKIAFDGECANPIHWGCKLYLNEVPITEFIIPDGITEVGDYMLSGGQFTSITIPEGVTRIGKGAFGNCKNLAYINIPESVTEIDDYAFHRCEGLESIIIPDSVIKIGEDAFIGCKKLKSITIPNSVKKIGCGAFSFCYELESITIPDGITEVRWQMFSSCNGLTSVTLPESVTKIGPDVFYGCTNLVSVSMPGVAKVEKCIFSGIRSLQRIVAPKISPEDYSPEIKRALACGFATAFKKGYPIPPDSGEKYMQYIKNQRKKLYPNAVAEPDLLWLMLRENMIPSADFAALQVLADLQGNEESKAILSEYL